MQSVITIGPYKFVQAMEVDAKKNHDSMSFKPIPGMFAFYGRTFATENQLKALANRIGEKFIVHNFK